MRTSPRCWFQKAVTVSTFWMHLNFIKIALYVSAIARNTVSTKDVTEYFYNLSLEIFKIGNDSNNGEVVFNPVHLVRVPKASSSSLSAIARRIKGCEPWGPCCKYPGTWIYVRITFVKSPIYFLGEPPGSCPVRGLFECQVQGKVIGCTGHNSNYPQLISPHYVSISMMREPLSRAISAFFYPGIHHNRLCTAYICHVISVYN